MSTVIFSTMIIGSFLIIYVSIIFDLNIFSVVLLFSILAVCLSLSVCECKSPPKLSASYEITVNEKTFKASDFKTKEDGSIEFTADDGTIIRASTYKIRKLNQETSK